MVEIRVSLDLLHGVLKDEKLKNNVARYLLFDIIVWLLNIVVVAGLVLIDKRSLLNMVIYYLEWCKDACLDKLQLSLL